MSYTYEETQKRFFIDLLPATSESDAVEWVTFSKVENTNNYTYKFNDDFSNATNVASTASHNLGNGINIFKTQVIAKPECVIVFGNIETGEVYVHDSNIIDDLHTVMDNLKTPNFLYADNRPYKFGGIDYFDYNESTNKWSIPEQSFTLSIMSLKRSSIVEKDRQIVLNDKVNEYTFAQTRGNEKSIYYLVDSGKKVTNGITTTINSLEAVPITEFEPNDKVIYNRLRLLDNSNNFKKTVYAPNISVRCDPSKWIYIRNRSNGTFHNTYLSEIDNLHLYLTSAYSHPTSGTGIAELNYLNILDKHTKAARDWADDFQYIYTVSAEDQAPLNDIARQIIMEEDNVSIPFAESNGLNDGTGYRFMDGDDNDLSFKKLESRIIKVDGKKFYYPIVSVRAPVGKAIRIVGAAKGSASNNIVYNKTDALGYETFVSVPNKIRVKEASMLEYIRVGSKVKFEKTDGTRTDFVTINSISNRDLVLSEDIDSLATKLIVYVSNTNYFWETKTGFIDDIISYILNGDSSRPAGFRGLGFASVEGNNQYILLADHFGNTTEFSVEVSNLVNPNEENVTFLDIYDPLFFEPNLYSPNLDMRNRLNSSQELPFISTVTKANKELERAIFLMREDYLNDDGNLISGNLTKEAFITLLVKLMLQENQGSAKTTRLLNIYGRKKASSLPFEKPKNLMIIKEEFKGRIERRLRRLTDEYGEPTPEPENGALQTNLHLNSILHLIYDYTGIDGDRNERKEMVIEIREDRDDLVFGFDPTGSMDQIINVSETGTYFNNRNHHILKLRNKFTENSSSDNIRIPLNTQFRPDPSGDKALREGADGYYDNLVPYIPIVRLNYNVQKELQEEFYRTGDIEELPGDGVDFVGPNDSFEKFKRYLENTTDGAEIHYLVDRDILMSYDTDLNLDKKAGENLEFGRNYVIMDMQDADELSLSNEKNNEWDFYDSEGKFNKGYLKIEFVPILNEIIKVYYQPGARILKKNIDSKVYYRDALTGYISLLHGDQYLNKSLEYFIEKDINFRIPEVIDRQKRDNLGNLLTDEDSNPIMEKVIIDKIEIRRYRLYLDFVPALPEYNYNKDPRIYDNNIFITNFSLSDLNKNKVFLKFSADETKDDMYKIYLSDNSLMKGISGDGKVTVTYQTIIDEVMYHMEKYFGVAKDKDPYDSEIHLGSLVMEEEMIDEPVLADGTHRFKRISIRPEFAQLQKIIISKDGSTQGADSVVINLTVYMNKNEPRPGLLLQETVNSHFSTQGYRIKVLQEEREGLKLYNLNHLDTRTYLSFNSVYKLHIGLNDSKRIVVRERIVRDIVEFDNDPNGSGRNDDQTLTISMQNDFLRVPLFRRLDVIKEIGGDVTTINPADNLTVEAYFDSTLGTINNNLLTRKFFLDKLGLRNFEFVYILNNRKFAFDEGTYDSEDADIDVGIGFFKLVFTTLINKILAVHFDQGDLDDSNKIANLLNVSKLSINKRVYYKDSILNDYVSLINEDFGNFNKELEYFIESTVDNVTYRLRLDFRPMPVIYDDNVESRVFKLGHMINLNTTLHLAWDTNVTLLFSSDNTTDDMHQINLSKSLLLNNVDNNGNILLSYTTIRNIMETEMRNLYGKSWYDREMYLFGVICNGQYVMGDGRFNGIKILISPFEYNINKVLEIDLDVGTVTYVDQLPEEKWDYSVKSYGEFIAGVYEPDNAGDGNTEVKIFEKAFSSAAILFDERNPDYNVKEVYLDTEGKHYAVVALGNVDPTSLQNLVNGVYLPDHKGMMNTDVTTINPTYIFNPIQISGSLTVNNHFYKTIARGFNTSHQMTDFYARDYVGGFPKSIGGGLVDPVNFGVKASEDTLKSAYLRPIVHKMLSASLFTRFDNTVFVSYKDSEGLDKNIDDIPNFSSRYPFMDYTNENNGHYLSNKVNTYKKRDLIMAKIKSELQTKEPGKGEKLYDSNLFKLYNALGKYETDLEKHLQRIPTIAKGDYLPYQLYDLEDFTINLLVKFKGTVSGSNNTKAEEASREEIEEGNTADVDPGINSGGSSSKIVLQNLVNEFFPESNVYVDDKGELDASSYDASWSAPFQARIRYETMVKFQFINKQVSDDYTLMKLFDNTVDPFSLDDYVPPNPNPSIELECLDPVVKVSVVGRKYILNNSNVYSSYNQFGLNTGTYIFENIPQSHPMAILNNGNTNIRYLGDNSKKLSKMVTGTTNDGTYDFYYGTMSVTVSGDFGTVSIYCYHHGYMGGEDILTYSESCETPPEPDNKSLNNEKVESLFTNNSFKEALNNVSPQLTGTPAIYYGPTDDSVLADITILYPIGDYNSLTSEDIKSIKTLIKDQLVNEFTNINRNTIVVKLEPGSIKASTKIYKDEDSLPPLNVEVTKTDIYNIGESTGSITLNITGGNEPEVLGWLHNGESFGNAGVRSLSNLSPGTYKATVINLGIESNHTVEIMQPEFKINSYVNVYPDNNDVDYALPDITSVSNVATLSNYFNSNSVDQLRSALDGLKVTLKWKKNVDSATEELEGRFLVNHQSVSFYSINRISDGMTLTDVLKASHDYQDGDDFILPEIIFWPPVQRLTLNVDMIPTMISYGETNDGSIELSIQGGYNVTVDEWIYNGNSIGNQGQTQLNSLEAGEYSVKVSTDILQGTSFVRETETFGPITLSIKEEASGEGINDAINLGVLYVTSYNKSVNINTFHTHNGTGSYDTEIGLYDSNESLISNNDDISHPISGNNNRLSAITINLEPGEYYVAVGTYNTEFSNSGVTDANPGFEITDLKLKCSSVNTTLMSESKELFRKPLWFKFTVEEAETETNIYTEDDLNIYENTYITASGHPDYNQGFNMDVRQITGIYLSSIKRWIMNQSSGGANPAFDYLISGDTIKSWTFQTNDEGADPRGTVYLKNYKLYNTPGDPTSGQASGWLPKYGYAVMLAGENPAQSLSTNSGENPA